jgi:hypothetical protein
MRLGACQETSSRRRRKMRLKVCPEKVRAVIKYSGKMPDKEEKNG